MKSLDSNASGKTGKTGAAGGAVAGAGGGGAGGCDEAAMGRGGFGGALELHPLQATIAEASKPITARGRFLSLLYNGRLLNSPRIARSGLIGSCAPAGCIVGA